MSNVIRQVAGSLGITLLSTYMQNSQVELYSRISEQVNWFNPSSLYLVRMLQGWFTQVGMSPTESQGISTVTLYGIVQKQATMLAIDDTFYVTFLIAAGTIFLALLLKGKQVAKSPAEKHVVVE